MQRIVRGSDVTDNTLLKKDIAPNIDVEVTDYGLRIYTSRKSAAGENYLRITNFVLPNLSAFGGATVGEGYAVHWHVPVDDTRHWKYIFAFNSKRPLDPEIREKSRAELTPEYHLTRTRDNRYRQDRDSMKTDSFTGIGFNFQAHDAFATESQGRVQDRTSEHLVSSDKAIIAARKLLLNAINDVKNGRDPQHVIRDPERNRFPHLLVLSELVPASTDHKAYVRERAANGT